MVHGCHGLDGFSRNFLGEKKRKWYADNAEGTDLPRKCTGARRRGYILGKEEKDKELERGFRGTYFDGNEKYSPGMNPVNTIGANGKDKQRFVNIVFEKKGLGY